MSGSSTSYRHSDVYSRSNKDYRRYDHRRDHPRDSRDNHRSDYNQKRVPGLVSDPDRQLGDVDTAIRRGQRETIVRVQSDRYSASRNNKATKDTLTPTLPTYRSAVMTVSQPYYPTSSRASYKRTKRNLYNPGFLAFLPGFAALALLITAIVLVDWITVAIVSGNDFQIINKGLFVVCTTSASGGTVSDGGCQTLEQFADSGSVISDLEQATRGMMVIAAIVAFVAVIVSFVLGLNKLERPKGAIIAGGLYAFAGACGTTGMGCFSAVLVDSINSSTDGIGFTFAGKSFFLGWAGTGLLFIASITSFLGHCARRK